MSIVAAPGATFEAYSPTFATGLVGTVGVRIRTGAGADFLARTTAGIAEDVTVGGNAVYRRTFTAPTTAGQYWVVWDDGTTVEPPEELVVTRDALTPFAPTGNEYVTVEELKQTLNLQATDFADDDIAHAVEAASRCCDAYKHTRFYPTSETRYYTGHPGDGSLKIDDLNTLTTLEVDEDGDGTHETTWAAGTDFLLAPANYAADGRPANELVILEGRQRFPRYEQSVKITGSFGWAATPAAVREATSLYAHRLLKRKRDTPYAIMTVVAGEAVAAARLGRLDPDVAFLLDHIPGATRSVLTSLQLG